MFHGVIQKITLAQFFFLRHGDIEIIVGRVYCQLPKGAYREKELNWIELNWTELNWTEMSWFASSSA